MDIINAESVKQLGLSNRQAKKFAKILTAILAYNADWEGFGLFIPFVNQAAKEQLRRLNVPPFIWGITEVNAILKACIEEQVI